MINRLTIITLTYNNFTQLVQTLNSTAAIEGVDRLVINGGQCPKTLAHLAEHNINHISEPDKGISDALNKGINHCQTPYLYFLHSGDCLIDPTYPQMAIEMLDQNPEIDFVHADILIKKNAQKTKKLRANFKNIGRGMPFMHPSVIQRKTMFDKIGHFDLSFNIAMDYELALRMQKNGIKGHYLIYSPVLMDAGGISNNQEQKSLKECYQALKKHRRLNLVTKLNFYFRYIKFLLRSSIKLLKSP